MGTYCALDLIVEVNNTDSIGVHSLDIYMPLPRLKRDSAILIEPIKMVSTMNHSLKCLLRCFDDFSSI